MPFNPIPNVTRGQNRYVNENLDHLFKNVYHILPEKTYTKYKIMINCGKNLHPHPQIVKIKLW